MCMSVLPPCMSGYHVHAVSMPEEGFRSLGTRVTDVWEAQWVLGAKPRSSARAGSVLNY